MSQKFRVVSVVSCKGGAGKSMIAANLAMELQARGLKVGLLDADVDSPYIVEIIGAKGRVGLAEQTRNMVPVTFQGMPIMSFALWTPDEFVGASMPGMMHERWIEDALLHTDWGDIDILVVDLPAGLGDEYLTVSRIERERLMGMVVVAQPQVLSGLKRVFDTASYHHLAILGVIENMSGDVFGSGPIEKYCRENQLQFFGNIPLDPRIRKNNEAREPRLPSDIAGPVMRACDQILVEVKA